MNIAFTICSNNYLAQAKTLGDSLLRENPEWLFYICLCDTKHPDVDYDALAPMRIVEASELGIDAFSAMCQQYNIIELNTSIKPFAFTYLYRAHPDAKIVAYFDPDISVYAPLSAVENELQDNAALLTPHILTPLEFDGKSPDENTFTQFGIYNLGFLATARDERIWPFFDWWRRRLKSNCYMLPEKGVFVDQLPMNLAPVFFDGFKVSRHPGMNMAPWNLHERRLSFDDGRYCVNAEYPLLFYHFSNFKVGKIVSGTSCSMYSRAHAADESAFLALNKDYERRLLGNDHISLSALPCVYGVPLPSKKRTPAQKFLRSIKKRLGMAEG